MKKITMGLVLMGVALLAGCSWNGGDGSDEDTMQLSSDTVGVVACDNYIEYMTCVADALGSAGDSTKKALDKTVDAWKTMPVDQLEQICQAAINGVSQVKDMYKDYDCTLNEAISPS